MHAARRKANGELAAWHIAFVVKLITGESLNPSEINPYRGQQKKSEAMRRLEEWQRKTAWRIKHGHG